MKPAISQVIQVAAMAISPDSIRASFVKDLVAPRLILRLAGDLKASFKVRLWVIAEPKPGRVLIAYSETPYPDTSCRWALLKAEDTTVGSSGSWYDSLADLVGDSGFY